MPQESHESKSKRIVETRKILLNFWKTNTWARRKRRKNPKKFKNQMHQMWEKPLKATCCQVLQSCCAASWRQRVKIQLVVGEKKLRLWKGGLWGGPDCRNSSRLFFSFFFLSLPPSQSLSLPLACGWSRKRGASEAEEEKEERGRAREREKGRETERERERGADHECTVKGRNALLMMK